MDQENKKLDEKILDTLQNIWNKTKDENSSITKQEIREAILITEIKVWLAVKEILVNHKENERTKRIEEAAIKLVNKIDAVSNSDAYKNVFVIAAIHNCPYRGDNFGIERDELFNALNQK